MREPGRVFHIESLDDPRVGCFRNLKDRELAAMGDLFITEGLHTTVRLLSSGHQVVSVMVTGKRLDQIEPSVPASVPVYVVPDDVIDGVIGFKFHSGVIGCGRRDTAQTLDDFMAKVRQSRAQRAGAPPETLVVCPDIANVDNAGSLIRISSAMGADGILFGQQACDPYWRRAIRVSMGNVFLFPVHRSFDTKADLLRLRDHYGYTLAGAVLDTDAVPLASFRRPERVAILLGNEAQGLAAAERALLDVKLTIPMHHGTDSLNIAVAGAVFLYELTRPALLGDASPTDR